MTVLLVLCTLVIFMIADYAVEKTRAAKAAAELKSWDAERIPFGLPAGVALAPNHLWVREERGVTTVGLDGFIGRMLGTVQSVMTPDVGAAVTPATVNIALRDRDRTVSMASPVAGTIVAVNPVVARDPGLIRRDPYGAGWLMKVQTDRHAPATARVLSGTDAVTWLRAQTDLVKEFLAGVMPAPQLATLQDGGIPAEGVLQLCDASVWKKFEERFTSLDRPDRPTT
jgi:glycine cleavage system H lipoate-binding protein